MDKFYCTQKLSVCDQKCEEDFETCEHKKTLEDYIEYCIDNGIKYEHTISQNENTESGNFDERISKIFKSLNIASGGSNVLKSLFDSQFKLQLLDLLYDAFREWSLFNNTLISFDDDRNEFFAFRPSDITMISFEEIKENEYNVEITFKNGKTFNRFVTKKQKEDIIKMLNIYHVLVEEDEG